MFQAMFNNLLIIYQGLPCFSFFSKLPNTYKRMCMFDRKHKKNLGKQIFHPGGRTFLSNESEKSSSANPFIPRILFDRPQVEILPSKIERRM